MRSPILFSYIMGATLTTVYLLIVTQEAEELFEIVSQALLSSVDRDCLSGWGGHVFVV